MSDKEKQRINLGKTNLIILVAGLVILVIGYIVMAMNDITISPILLTITYLVIIPIGLLYKPKKKD